MSLAASLRVAAAHKTCRLAPMSGRGPASMGLRGSSPRRMARARAARRPRGKSGRPRWRSGGRSGVGHDGGGEVVEHGRPVGWEPAPWASRGGMPCWRQRRSWASSGGAVGPRRSSRVCWASARRAAKARKSAIAWPWAKLAQAPGPPGEDAGEGSRLGWRRGHPGWRSSGLRRVGMFAGLPVEWGSRGRTDCARPWCLLAGHLFVPGPVVLFGPGAGDGAVEHRPDGAAHPDGGDTWTMIAAIISAAKAAWSRAPEADHADREAGREVRPPDHDARHEQAPAWRRRGTRTAASAPAVLCPSPACCGRRR